MAGDSHLSSVLFPSGLLQAVVHSNELKQKNLGPDGWLETGRTSLEH
jgi:hypothetical protein